MSKLCLPLSNRHFNKCHKEGVGRKGAGEELGMELDADKEGVVFELDDFDEVAFGVDARDGESF